MGLHAHQLSQRETLIFGTRFLRLPEIDEDFHFLDSDKIYADHGIDVCLPASFDKVITGRSIVYIRQGETANVKLSGKIHQLFNRKGSISQAKIHMAIKVHHPRA